MCSSVVYNDVQLLRLDLSWGIPGLDPGRGAMSPYKRGYV